MIVKLDAQAWDFHGDVIRAADKEYKEVTRNWNLYVGWLHADAWGWKNEDGELVSFAAIAPNKRPKIDGWGKYINSYLVYTLPAHRLKGYATTLHRTIELTALKHGWSRTQSLIQTYAGFRFHLHLRHTFWGLNKRGEIRCDSPLDHKAATTGIGVPAAARDAIDPHPLTVEELIEILHNSPLYGQRSRAELQAVFDTHPLGYNPTAWLPRPTLI